MQPRAVGRMRPASICRISRYGSWPADRCCRANRESRRCARLRRALDRTAAPSRSWVPGAIAPATRSRSLADAMGDCPNESQDRVVDPTCAGLRMAGLRNVVAPLAGKTRRSRSGPPMQGHSAKRAPGRHRAGTAACAVRCDGSGIPQEVVRRLTPRPRRASAPAGGAPFRHSRYRLDPLACVRRLSSTGLFGRWMTRKPWPAAWWQDEQALESPS